MLQANNLLLLHNSLFCLYFLDSRRPCKRGDILLTHRCSATGFALWTWPFLFLYLIVRRVVLLQDQLVVSILKAFYLTSQELNIVVFLWLSFFSQCTATSCTIQMSLCLLGVVQDCRWGSCEATLRQQFRFLVSHELLKVTLDLDFGVVLQRVLLV